MKNMEILYELVRVFTTETFDDSKIIWIGPRELSVKRASAISALQGLQSECRKSPWYGHVTNDPTKASIHSTRDFEDHKRRKRAWDQAFSIKGM